MTAITVGDRVRGWLLFLVLTMFMSPLQRIANHRRSLHHSLDLFYSLLPRFQFLCPQKSVLRSLDSFLNWGFCPENDLDDFTQFVAKLPPAEQQFPYGAYHYYRLLRHERLDNKSILEVGCGRGGGCRHVLAPFFSPKKYVGLDLSYRLIKICRAHKLGEHYHFLNGSAQHLPFASNSFDIVLNVESSHCYPSFKSFLKEVERVLRPGGRFVFTDLRWWRGHDIRSGLAKQLQSTGMEVISFKDISDSILLARKLVSKKIIRMDKVIFKYNRDFADACCLNGSGSFEMLQKGTILYFEAILEKK